MYDDHAEESRWMCGWRSNRGLDTDVPARTVWIRGTA